jgi:hypothetical protein
MPFRVRLSSLSFFNSLGAASVLVTATAFGPVLRGADAAALASVPVSGVTASGWAPQEQVPANAIDGDPRTRWSAEGNDHWLRLDLGAVREIAAVEIAFPNGTRRNELFLLQVSTDGDSWTEVFGGQSAGKSADFERFTFPARSARFVRYVGFGNSDNAWNNVGEIKVLGPATPP